MLATPIAADMLAAQDDAQRMCWLAVDERHLVHDIKFWHVLGLQVRVLVECSKKLQRTTAANDEASAPALA